MASISLAIFSMFLLTFANSRSTPDHDAPIELIVPDECLKKDFCSLPPVNYEEIQQRIKKLLPTYNIDTRTDVQVREGMTSKVRYSNRTDWHNCPSMEQMEDPEIARDPLDYSQYNAVIQDKKNYQYRQTFITVRCPIKKISELSYYRKNRQCFPDVIDENNTYGVISECAERYTSRTLYIYDHKENKLIMKNYLIPISCSCKLKPK